MHILFDSHVLGKNKTGLNRYTTSLVKTLRKTDVKISLYTPYFQSGLYRIVAGFTLAVQSNRPDILHVQNFTPLVKTCPIVNTVHDLCFREDPHSFSLQSRAAFLLFFKRSILLSDRIIAVSQSVKKNLIKYYDIDPDKIEVIYEAASNNFQPLKDKKYVLSYLVNKFGIHSSYFLVVGDCNKRKQITTIVEAFRTLSVHSKNTQLILAGPYKNKIQGENIINIGYVSDYDLNVLYNGTSALVINSSCEGFGLPLVEAMACKTPIICNDIDVFREICNKSAMYTHDEKDIAQAMKDLLIKSNYNKYSEWSYKESKRFSWDITASKTISVYNEVLNGYEYTKKYI